MVSLLLCILCSLVVMSQSPSTTSIFIKAGKLLDVRHGVYIENAGIWIEGERIKEVGRGTEIQSRVPPDAKVIDLGRRTVLPGLIDCHTTSWLAYRTRLMAML